MRGNSTIDSSGGDDGWKRNSSLVSLVFFSSWILMALLKAVRRSRQTSISKPVRAETGVNLLT